MTVKPRAWLIFIILAFFGLCTWFKLSYSQFSVINLSVDKNQALNIATNYLFKTRQINLSEFKKAIIFISDTNADSYLQKSLGFNKENDFIKEHDFDLFLWLIRFFKENEKEEFRLTVSASSGQITSLRHTIKDSDARENLDENTAKEKVIHFLKDNFSFDPKNYTLHANNRRKLDNRVDFSFSWNKNNVAIPWNKEPDSGTTKLIIGATVSGNEILSFFKNNIEIPEQFSRYIEKKKYTGRRLNFLFFVLYLVLLTGAIFFVVARRNHLAIHVAKNFCIGLTLVLFVFNILTCLNEFESVLFSYDSTIPLRSYLLNYSLELILYTFLLTISVLMPSLAGESLHHELSKKNRVGSFLHYITSSFFSRNVSQCIMLGYLVAIILVGLQTALFDIGYRYLGVWVERNWITQLSSTYLPFVSAFILSFRASVIEEVTFRIFAINWFKKITKSTIIAAILVSLIWGYGHSHYLIFPMWFRGLEVTCLGLVLAYVYLQYGIIPVLVAHYLFDAFWGSASYLLGKTNPFYFYSALLVMLLPMLWATIAFILNKTDTEEAMRWKLNKHQLYNLQILREFLKDKKNLGEKTPEEFREELISHGWDVAVVDAALLNFRQLK